MKPLRQHHNPRHRKAPRTASIIIRALFDHAAANRIVQASVAEALGVSQSTLSHWKSGYGNTDIVTMEAFANLLGYRVVLVKISDDSAELSDKT